VRLNDQQLVNNESAPARIKRDMMDENKIVSVLQRLKGLALEASCDIFHNLSSNDQATVDIQESLLNAK